MKKQKGFSLTELLIVVAIIMVIAAIAIPNLLKSRIASNESSALATMRTYNNALSTYAAQCPATGYPASFVNLSPGAGDCNNAALVDAVLGVAAPIKAGYSFAYRNPGTSGGVAGSSYDINANPLTRGTTGQRSFFMDQTGLVHYNGAAASTVADPAIQ
jgi:type IV pilus assembly protein PilA